MNEDINKLVEKAIEDRTLTLEAADAIALLRKEHSNQQSNIEALKISVNNLDRENSSKSSTITILNKELEDLRAMESALVVREAKQLRLEIENEHLNHRIKDYREMMLSLTRNLEYRNAMFGNRDEADQYGAVMTRNHGETDTRTVE